MEVPQAVKNGGFMSLVVRGRISRFRITYWKQQLTECAQVDAAMEPMPTPELHIQYHRRLYLTHHNPTRVVNSVELGRNISEGTA